MVGYATGLTLVDQLQLSHLAILWLEPQQKLQDDSNRSTCVAQTFCYSLM